MRRRRRSPLTGSAFPPLVPCRASQRPPLSSHEFSDEELEVYRDKISDVAEGIRSGLFETKKGNFNCQYCDYKEFLCPAWEEG